MVTTNMSVLGSESRGVSGYREKQSRWVLSRQLGCGLISLPGTGEVLGVPFVRQLGLQTPRTCVLLALILASPQHA